MATLTFEFEIHIPGLYQIGYRNYTMGPTNFVTQNITYNTVGVKTFDIPITGNLYCAYDGIEYNIYVVPECLNTNFAIDSNGDGIPDGAETFNITVPQQTDPYAITKITCIAAPLNQASVVITGNGVGNCTPNGDYTLTIVPVTPGDEIEPGEVHATVFGNVITEITVITPGLYKVAPTLDLSVITGCDVAPTATIGLDPYVIINPVDYIGSEILTDIDSNYNLGNPEIEMEIGDEITFVAEIASLASLPASFESDQLSAAHCGDCNKHTISAAGASSGSGIVIYSRCWDNTTASMQLVIANLDNGDEIVTTCVLDDTVTILEKTLDASPVDTPVVCS